LIHYGTRIAKITEKRHTAAENGAKSAKKSADMDTGKKTLPELPFFWYSHTFAKGCLRTHRACGP
jgi:hypothetical protein